MSTICLLATETINLKNSIFYYSIIIQVIFENKYKRNKSIYKNINIKQVVF